MLEVKTLETDILIIGGGTAGCWAAINIAENSNKDIIIAEKANIKRGGCLAAGVNALNAYINEGQTVDSFTDYVRDEFEGIVREDLVYTIAKGLNKSADKLHEMGLPILKDENGKYASRGKRSIKINGEGIKPLIAGKVLEHKNIRVIERINITDYIVKNGEVIGAYGFSLDKEEFYVIYSKATICATGGAAGIYKPNNSGQSPHKMWYSPFNTGAGLAMGIRAGAEMTSFEMRFIALRCKDTIAPTGTVAQGVKTPHINAKGEEYLEKYGYKTHLRLYGTVMENINGNGPCYLKTEGISEESENQLFKAYLNMAPAQALRWMDSKKMPSENNIEIEGTEPYIVGGHSLSGYWVDTDRRSTLKGLFVAGDVAGGAPKKYVTGCFVEGEIVAEESLKYIENKSLEKLDSKIIEEKKNEVEKYFNGDSVYSINSIEEAMQKVMDEYAGGISSGYGYNMEGLEIAESRISRLLELSKDLKCNDMHELLFIHEVIDRLLIAKVLIKHMQERKETRLRCYCENQSYKEKDDVNYKKYVNSVFDGKDIKITLRDIVERGQVYEH
ncbi:adenylyl-sulfate reductase subunit alpha [Clostridium cylindrosporum]|uniref:Adenylylsulfate reductase, subunit alpha n=1 Tax=Clostridium cylindrosporum DSM 605 TaxID=1121307 RepID=A0A0J8DGG9_CLOCY|nr:adenylyl-sulfate reductase subunit alpha [Clostridium cylindrosporum]KMT23324.1 adenylylsulfate reductase, subunit alpha [Clostridium cylindrosporum DSM 605]